MRWPALLGLVLIALALVGCGPFVDQRNLQDRADTPSGLLGGSATVGERFVAGCDNLSAVDVQLAVYPDVSRANAQLILALAPAADPARVLGEARFDESAVTPNEWAELALSPISGSAGQSYLLTAWSTSSVESAVTPWATSHWADPANQRFVNDRPTSGALVYRAWCDPPPLSVARDTIASVTRVGLLWPVALLLVILPGLGAALLLDRRRDDLATLLGGAIGWSVLLAPLALAAVTPIRDVTLAAILLPLAGGIVAVGILGGLPSPPAPPPAAGEGRRAGVSDRLRGNILPRDMDDMPRVAAESNISNMPINLARDTDHAHSAPCRPCLPLPRAREEGVGGEGTPPVVVALIATMLAVGIRAATAKDLVVPAWGDSVQHSYVTQLILASGGVPSTYGPLMPPQIFDYHFGLQSIVAYASILTGASAPSALLAVGQLLDALICLAVYRFARDLTSSRWAGAVAATLVALVTIQPTYYVSWGRYTELAGLVALPAAFAAMRAALGQQPRKRDVAAAIVAAGAMILVHPRVAIFLAGLAVAEALVRPGEPWRPARALASFGRLALLGGASLILVSPWVARLWQAHHQQLQLSGGSMPIVFPVGLATTGDDRWVVIFGLLGLAVAFARGSRLAPLTTIWFALVFVAANPTTFHLPMNLALDNGALAIAAFLPAAVFAGYLVENARGLLSGLPWPRLAPWGAGAVLLLAGLSQSPTLVGILNPTCLLLRPGDVGAIAWVAANTPPGARFVVNDYLWAPNIYMGSDSGYWLPVLTGRPTTLPFLFYPIGPAAEYRQVSDRAARIEAAGNNPDALATIAAEAGARYVFIGTRGGDLDPGPLVASGRFKVDYGAGGAWVLELVGAPSSRTTSTGVTPTGVGMPSETNAAGLRSRTSG